MKSATTKSEVEWPYVLCKCGYTVAIASPKSIVICMRVAAVIGVTEAVVAVVVGDCLFTFGKPDDPGDPFTFS